MINVKGRNGKSFLQKVALFFHGVACVPILGNAVQVATSVIVARRNRNWFMELTRVPPSET